MVGKICRKRKFLAWGERVLELMEEVQLKELGEAELERLVRG